MSRERTAPIAMVLAAGRGRRMRPLSDVLPKPALPVLDRPVVAWPLELARRAGARRIALNVWHLPNAMEAAVRSLPGGRDVSISVESQLLGGAGGLAAARDAGLLDDDGPVLVLNGDGLVDLDPEPLFERHHTAGDLVTLALLSHPDPGRWSSITLDGDGRISAILPPGSAPETDRPWLYPGVMLLDREALNAIPPGPGETAERLWEPARIAGRLGGAVVRGSWREVGTPADYRAVVRDLLGTSSWTGGVRRIASSAMLARSMAGEGVSIGPHTTVSDSILSHGVTIGAECRIEDSVILGPLCIPDRSVLRGVIATHPLPAHASGTGPASI